MIGLLAASIAVCVYIHFNYTNFMTALGAQPFDKVFSGVHSFDRADCHPAHLGLGNTCHLGPVISTKTFFERVDNIVFYIKAASVVR